MKILFVIAALRNGGAERVLQVLSNSLAKDNDISIAILEENENLYKFDKNIKFIYLDVYKSGFKLNKYIKLRNCFKEENPDIIISFIDWTNVACVISNVNLCFPLIATEHNANNYLQNSIFRIIRNFAYKKVSALSVLSKKDYDYYSKFVKNCEVIYNPFFGENYNLEKKENIILSVARLEDVKGYDGYIKALSLINRELLGQWRIVVAGDGSQKEKLIKLANDLELNIEFLGHIENVSEFYKKAKIFVLNSKSEGLPNVLIESAFYGCARISSKTYGAEELIEDGVDGILIPVDKSEILANNLERMMKDEKLCENLVKNANKILYKFELKNVLEKWKIFIEKTLKNKDL